MDEQTRLASQKRLNNGTGKREGWLLEAPMASVDEVELGDFIFCEMPRWTARKWSTISSARASGKGLCICRRQGSDRG